MNEDISTQTTEKRDRKEAQEEKLKTKELTDLFQYLLMSYKCLL